MTVRAVLIMVMLCGCASRRDGLSFPHAPLDSSPAQVRYDVNANGRSDFILLSDSPGRIDRVAYDDDEDGSPDRVYRLADYRNEDVPHLIILLDSIPYQAIADRYSTGEFRWFDPPQRLIPPFPSMSEGIFTQILQSPPLPGMIDSHYDPRTTKTSSGVMQRVGGYHQPWEFRCNYVAKYYEGALSYVQPRDWFRTELGRAKKAIDESPDRVTIVYLVSTSGMLCRYGREGLSEVLDQIQRMCLQILFERQGAVKISMLADHGHNMVESKNFSLMDDLKNAGLRNSKSVHDPRDVVIDLDGLVTYLGIHTMHPMEVAEVVLRRHEVQLAMYMQQDCVIVRDSQGSASIEMRDGRLRYRPVDRDVLDYNSVLEKLRNDGRVSADGFVADEVFFTATVDHEWPDAPRRIWDAFHGQVVNPPDLMLSIRDGYCCGHASLERFITMASTHGGLNQVNSATFLLTMTGRAEGPLRSRDVMATIEPGYLIPVRR